MTRTEAYQKLAGWILTGKLYSAWREDPKLVAQAFTVAIGGLIELIADAFADGTLPPHWQNVPATAESVIAAGELGQALGIPQPAGGLFENHPLLAKILEELIKQLLILIVSDED